MKKLGLKAGLLTWAASLLLASFGVPAQAAGEAYRWKDANRSTIEASGGVYARTTTFTEASRDNVNIIYTTSADNFTCPDGTAFDADLRISVSLAQHGGSADTPARISANWRCGPGPDGQASISGTAPANPLATGSSDEADSGVPRENCDGGVLSWILCPVITWITQSIESIENNVIVPFLKIDPLSFDSQSTQHTMWRQTRNLANIGFVIVMLVIVFANTLSIQVDYYTIKRSIPRLAVAAIAIQFSYLLVALLIDFTNILGAGIGQLVLSPVAGEQQITITNLVGGLGIAGGIGLAFAALGSIASGGFIMVVIASFFAVMAVFLTLVFRQILITFLLIAAPVAILAWTLPNTEGWFKLWRNTLVKTLMMYPILVLFFVSGKIFGAATAAGSGGGFQNDSFRSLISIVATILPLLLVPFAFKFAGSAVTAGAALIGRLTAGTMGRTTSSSWYERLQRRTGERKAELAAGHGVTFGRGRLSTTALGGAFGRTLGRGFYGSISKPSEWANTQGGNIRAMLQFNQQRDQKRDLLKKEGTSFEAYQILSKGSPWYDKELQKAHDEGNTHRVSRLRDALVEANFNNRMRDTTARAAATMFLSDVGQIGDSDREGILQWAGTTAGGRYVADNTWRSAREGARKITPHITYTNLDGSIDTAGLIGWWIGQNQSTMSAFTADAFSKMRDNGTLELMAQTESGRDVLAKLAGGGGPAAGAAQQSVIKSVLSSVTLPPAANQPQWAYLETTTLPDGTTSDRLVMIDETTARRYKGSGQGARVIKIDKSVDDL